MQPATGTSSGAAAGTPMLPPQQLPMMPRPVPGLHMPSTSHPRMGPIPGTHQAPPPSRIIGVPTSQPVVGLPVRMSGLGVQSTPYPLQPRSDGHPAAGGLMGGLQTPALRAQTGMQASGALPAPSLPPSLQPTIGQVPVVSHYSVRVPNVRMPVTATAAPLSAANSPQGMLRPPGDQQIRLVNKQPGIAYSGMMHNKLHPMQHTPPLTTSSMVCQWAQKGVVFALEHGNCCCAHAVICTVVLKLRKHTDECHILCFAL